MKKKIIFLFIAFLGLFLFVSCDSKSNEEEVYFDSVPTAIDHYFSNQVRLSDVGTTVKKNSEGKLAGDFIKDKIAKLAPKSITDGDTAVFHTNKYEAVATADSYTNPLGRSYDYLTVRFLGVDTPESTSSIDAWGKAASKYAKSLLTTAAGIIVDATDCAPEIKSGARLDSNGSRWLGLIWYCPQGFDAEDLSNYRLYQLDLIEECYSHYTGAINTNRIAYNTKKDKEPILYGRYKEAFGSIKISDLLLEAEVRMTKLELRIHGEIDPNFDYSKTPTITSIKDALANIKDLNNPNNYMEKGTLVQVTGVILRYIGNNIYIQDKDGACLYIYMGIQGNSIESLYKVGDTISIQGRLCEYGGQYQLSGIVFKSTTFKKVEGADAVSMPTPMTLAVGGKTTDLEPLLGRLVKTTIKVSSIGAKSKDGSYTLYSDDWKISDLQDKTSYDTLSIRVNGSLAPGYDRESFEVGKKYEVVGIMSIYSEMDLQIPENYPSYQIVVGNRAVENGVVVSEIVAK